MFSRLNTVPASRADLLVSALLVSHDDSCRLYDLSKVPAVIKIPYIGNSIIKKSFSVVYGFMLFRVYLYMVSVPSCSHTPFFFIIYIHPFPFS